jgi:hypothetical protein
VYGKNEVKGLKMKVCISRSAKVLTASVVMAAVIGAAQVALASISFTGSGTNPGDSGSTKLFGEADFSISGNTLTVILANTGTAATTDQGATLTGLMFNVMSASSTFSSMSLTPGSTIWTSSSGSNNATPIAGSWDAALQVTSYSGSAVNAGVATTGKNLFQGNGMSLGNASPDYGLVANGSFPAGSFGGSKFPFIQDSLTFNFNLSSSSISESQINDVFFLFGTNDSPGGVFPGTPGSPGGPPPPGPSVPEPASLAVWGIVSAATAGAVAMRKQKRGRGRWSEANRAAIYQVIGGKNKI